MIHVQIKQKQPHIFSSEYMVYTTLSYTKHSVTGFKLSLKLHIIETVRENERKDE